ncbi:MAG: CapA family protein [Bacillota bacterium]|nr:CapA family protein [Bacillota bacterium]
MKQKMRFTAAGDLLMMRELPADSPYEGLASVQQFIAQGDFRFANLETTIHRYECAPAQESGGSWTCADPAVLDNIKAFGFNLLSLANNHSLDFSFDGLIKTREYVTQAGLKAAGTGRTLLEAAQPVYLECTSGRCALIAMTASFELYGLAGEQSAHLPGRPGVNGLRVKTRYQVPAEQLRLLSQIASQTNMNAQSDISRREGYKPALAPGQMDFGGLIFEEGNECRRITEVDEQDLQRIEQMIFEATLQADAIIISLHAHQVGGTEKEIPDQFIETFSRRCIDVGAHAVIGHGPHLLRPLEIYKGRPIFYSLGDFVLQSENISRAPAQWFKTYKLSPDATMHELFATRSSQFSCGLYCDHKMFESVIPYWEMVDGQISKLKLMPVELGFGEPRSRAGWPRFTRDESILERLAVMSKPYGTQISICDGVGEVIFDTQS